MLWNLMFWKRLLFDNSDIDISESVHLVGARQPGHQTTMLLPPAFGLALLRETLWSFDRQDIVTLWRAPTGGVRVDRGSSA